MFKKLLIGTLAAVIVVAAGASVYTTLAAPAADPEPAAVVENAVSPVEPIAASADVVAPVDTTTLTTASAGLTADETSSLLYMYEEEKMARDVYNALYALWGQQTFQNIAVSEQAHMDAVKTLLDRYGIAAPSTAAGSFTNSTLQSLYDSLMATGSQSLADALKVGATIEEVDILDLDARLAQTTNADIQLVYTNLMNGSFNHLRNFVNALKQQTGETYQPQYLSADLYASILAGSNGTGQGAGMGSGASAGRGHGRGGSGSGAVSDPAATGSKGKGYRGGR